MNWQELKIQSNLHLLIVEDVIADVDLMVLALEAAGITFSYDTADTEIGCQQLLQEQNYDAVLADYRLPGLHGLQVLELVKQSEQEIPLILVTGALGEEAAVECIKAGMTDYVLKERLFRLPMVLERSLQEFELRRQKQADRARIFKQAQQEAIINRIVQAMRGTLRVDEVLQTTADQLHLALKVSRCLIFQPDALGQMRIYHISVATAERESFIGTKCSFYNYYKETLARGEAVVINRIDASLPLEIQEIAGGCGIRAIMIAPLLYQQSSLGGIILHQCDRERQWTIDELALVSAIAAQCAIAIHQAQLFSQVQQQAIREQLLNQISRKLNSSLDPEYILPEIVKLTGECFGVDRVVIFRFIAEKIQVLNEWCVSDQVVSMLDFRTPMSEWPDLLDPNSEFYSRRAFHAPDYAKLRTTPTRLMQIQSCHTLSVLNVPIFIRDQLFGSLAIHTTTTCRTFTDDEIHLLQRIADQAAIALYNAQSYERLAQLIRERTQQLEQEKLLSKAANRAKSEFIATMSHELRTPMVGILGCSSILLEEIFGPLNAKQKNYIENISTCGNHLLELINDLLDLTKIEAGKEELTLVTILVEEVCQACLSLIQERANREGLQLSLVIAPEIKTCVVDQRRLKQILFNLLSNAVKFTESGAVTLRVEQTEGAIRFSVIDTGIGITEADQATLFQPFQQLDSGLNRKYEGTGLGLALSRKLARLHGGDITLHSELGRGSCFTLHLPTPAVSPVPTVIPP